jgi:methylmalonyl-CoA/ethylmalonyl-CoA epimerase
VRDRRDGSGVTGLSFHHVGVVTKDLIASKAFYERLGYEASKQYDDPVQKVSIIFMRREAPPLIELIVPTQADSPAAGWLKRIKAGPYHTCYEVADLSSGIEFLKESGFTPLHEPVPAVAFDMRLIVFLWSPDVGLVELLRSEL